MAVATRSHSLRFCFLLCRRRRGRGSCRATGRRRWWMTPASRSRPYYGSGRSGRFSTARSACAGPPRPPDAALGRGRARVLGAAGPPRVRQGQQDPELAPRPVQAAHRLPRRRRRPGGCSHWRTTDAGEGERGGEQLKHLLFDGLEVGASHGEGKKQRRWRRFWLATASYWRTQLGLRAGLECYFQYCLQVEELMRCNGGMPRWLLVCYANMHKTLYIGDSHYVIRLYGWLLATQYK